MPLSNTTQEVLRSSPYWDDYNRDKRFHRVLIKPRVPVQTRELNQIQSILQNQVEQVTSSIYREGAAVSGGQQTLSNTCVALYVTRDESVNITNFYNTETAVGAYVRGLTSNATGIITQVTANTGTSYSAVVIAKLDANEFEGGESIQFSTIEGGDTIATMVAAPGTSTAPVTTPASTFSVDSGVFYLRGHLVDVPKQTIILNLFTDTPSKRIGLSIVETIVSSSEDQSLLDPALGTTNYAGPGADRLKLTATLVSRDIRNDAIDPNADADFVELLRVEAGIIQPIPERLQQEFIEDTLARRTYDESGDYVVSPFLLQVKDHNPPVSIPNITGFINGNLTSTVISAANTVQSITYANGSTANVTTLFTSEVAIGDTLVVNGESRDVVTVTNNTVLIVNNAFSQEFSNTPATIISPHKVNLELSKGVAYVRGYEVRTPGTTKLVANRARTTANLNNGAQSTAFGPYTIVNLNKGLFNTNTLERAELHCVPFAGINTSAINATSGNYHSSKIGSARVRGFAYYSGIGDANTTYKMYLIGAEFETKTLQVNTSGHASGNNSRLTVAVAVDATAKTIVLSQNAASSAGSVLAMANNAYVGAIIELRTTENATLRYPVLASTYSGNATTGRTQTLTLASDQSLATVNTTANVTLIFSDKCIRGMADSNAASKGASVHYFGKVGLDPNANTMMQSPTMTGMLFKYRETPINPASLSDESYSVLRYVGSVTGNAGTTGVTGFTIDATPSAGEVSSDQTLDIWRHMIAVRNSNGEVLSLVTANAAVSTAAITVQFANTQVAGSSVLHFYAPMERSNANTAPRTKTLYVGNTNLSSVTVNATGYLVSNVGTTTYKGHIAINSINTSSNGVIGLGIADVHRVQKVYAVKDANTIATNAAAIVDVTSRYTLDTGQRDWCYDHASISLKPGYVHYTTNCSQYLVVVDMFAHSAAAANLSYFSPASYRTASNTAMELEDIPSFINPKTGNTVSLANYVDFRPVRAANLTYANTATNPYNSIDTTFETTVLPIADGVYRADYAYYLPRIDKLVVTKDKRFQVITGLPSKNPEMPVDSASGITLYILNFPAYTATPDAVTVTPFEYKRYTMKDIGKLEKRIENLEYYASLSTMDLQSLNSPEFDESNNERFKNGIVTDMFSNHGVVNYKNPETKIAIDSRNNEMRPLGRVNRAYNVQLDTTNSSNVAAFGTNHLAARSGLIALPYTTEILTKQPLASKSVNINPFNVFSWRGSIELLPSSDTWIDTITRPDVTLNLFNENDGVAEGVIESHWDYWSTSSTGAPVETRGPLEYVESFDFFVDDGVNFGRPIQQDVTLTTTTTTTNFRRLQQTQRSLSFTTTDGGDRIVDTSIAPKMRGIDVDIAARGLLPGAQLQATFDDIDVTAYVERANEITTTAVTAESFRIGDIIKSSAGGDARVVGISTSGNTGILHVSGVTGIFTGATINVTSRSSAPSSITVAGYTHWHGRAQSVGSSGGYWTVQLDAGAPTTGDPYTGKVIYFTDGGYNSRINLNEGLLRPAVIDTPTGVGGTTATIRSYDAATRTVTLESLSPEATDAFTAQRTSYTTAHPIRYSIGRPETSTTGTGILVVPGTFYGMFRVPGYRPTTTPDERALSSSVQFNTGSRIFKLMNISSDTDSQARQSFVSQGSTITKERTLLRTRQIIDSRITGTVETFGTSTIDQSTTTTETVGYYDPLAQTFVVQNDQYPEGVFATHADLFFAKKGTSGMPVEVQLRRTVNGYPSSDEILAKVELPASKIKLVPEGVTPNIGNAAHYTRFEFERPEYLAPNAEYALVVLSQSNEYEVFVGELGKKLIGSAAIITEQPHGGSLFKSQNARTWVAEPLEDLMFVLHRAQFATSEGYAVFELANNTYHSVESASYDLLNVGMDYLDFDSTRNNTQFTVSTVTTDSTSSTLTMIPNQNLVMPERMEVSANTAGSVRVRARLRTTNPHVSPIYDVDRTSVRTIENYIDNGCLYANGFVFTTGTPSGTGTSPNTYPLTVTSATGTGATISAVTNSTGYVTSITVANAGYGYTETPVISLAANTDFTVQPTFTYVGETSPNSAIVGEKKARYTTRAISLADGFDASDLKVYLSASRGPQHNIEVYYKVMATGDTETFAQKPWVLMQLKPEQASAYSTSARTKREYEYTTVGSTASYTSNGTTFTRFHTFAIKIVLRSGQGNDPYTADTVSVPVISNLRAIALDE